MHCTPSDHKSTRLRSKCADLCSQAAVGARSAEGQQGLLEGRGQLSATPPREKEKESEQITVTLLCCTTRSVLNKSCGVWPGLVGITP